MRKRAVKMSCFYIPAICLILFFVVRPFCETVYVSLCKWNGYSPEKIFIGLENYKAMFSDKRLLTAFINTLIYGFVSTVLQNIIGLGAALFVNSRFKGNNLIRVVIYMPIMISSLIMGYIMYFFLTYDNGVLNDILGIFGKGAVDWLADGKNGVLFITIINTWQYAGYCMIIYLSGLQNISKTYIEAAEIDGAGSFARFRYITLPMLIPAITSAVMIDLIGGLKIFDGIISLTNGGPNYSTHSMMTYLNSQYFLAEKAGYASAIGITTFVMIMVVALYSNHYLEKKSIEA
ncbi:sugar ABC transporter permease [Eubacterium sp. am_0171]|uniref:Inner membrane ABC transporter permease protein ycjO n=1 Tax=Faecalicatena contorta TaxID=39482 RepID=A0A174AEB9_9FIRM|nr:MULTISPECIES: sugar ABC transporter permease [Clostridia]MSC83636.1 ABC transporter permease subunit [Eubacterium sp. BIOML-A1]MSD04653.1 ABC transporter permease subunit [Eubacterium sp. BIOML-A2]RYT25830.1 sugar ABC transporter permease [Eubacterium sp. am_0171]CUN85826.1 Inner membrane ABC transporter permease protein ycjO [[Eubacterium] contortum] [Faecalicatena contorta]